MFLLEISTQWSSKNATTPNTAPFTTMIHHQQPVPIHHLAPSDAHRYLGVYLTTDDNHNKEYQMFQQQNNTYTMLLQQCPFSQADIGVIYMQCYLPTVSYLLPATFIPPAKLYKAQGKVASLSIAKLSYPHSFPRAIAYANIEHSRLGLCHLGVEQGLQKSCNSSNTYALQLALARFILLSYNIMNSCWVSLNLFLKIHGLSCGAWHHGLTQPNNTPIRSKGR